MSMIAFEQIKELTKSLSTQEKKELVKEIEATLASEKVDEATVEMKQSRILGLHAHLGEGWMSEDFKNELPDGFWLGHE